MFRDFNGGTKRSPAVSVRTAGVLSCGASARFRVMASPYGASRSHSLDTSHSVGLLWTSDQPDSKISAWQHTILTRDKHPPPQRDLNPQSYRVSGRKPTLRPRGHLDRELVYVPTGIQIWHPNASCGETRRHTFIAQLKPPSHSYLHLWGFAVTNFSAFLIILLHLLAT